MIYVYDIEVFPNFFSAIFRDIETKQIHTFVITDSRNDHDKLVAFVKNNVHTLIGFNNVYFDDAILREVMSYNKNLNSINGNIYTMGQTLIDKDQDGTQIYRHRIWPYKKDWRQIDLMRMMNFHRQGVGLKQAAVNMKWHTIQDLPRDPDHIVWEEEIEEILKYNLNDVLITEELYFRVIDHVNLRADIGSLYEIDVLSSSRSRIAVQILEKEYEKRGYNKYDLKDLRTVRDEIQVSDCIADTIEFKTPFMQEFLDNLRSKTMRRHGNKFPFEEEVIVIGDVKYNFRQGGLHSQDDAGIFKTDKKHKIIDADVASYYPNIILVNSLRPEHLGSEFSGIYSDLVGRRLKAKRKGDKVTAEALKITVNSIFGKFGSIYSWLYDQRAMYFVTISGQLYLFMLIEALNEAGIEVISANTDGIVTKLDRDREDDYKEICDWWQKKTGLTLEFTEYDLYARSGVNSYVTIKSGSDTSIPYEDLLKNGLIKQKDEFITTIPIEKGYHFPIIAKALNAYLINGIQIMDTLLTHEDVMDFCMSEKTGKSYIPEYHTLAADKRSIDVKVLQKTNRFYISNKGGMITKHNEDTGKYISIISGQNVQILNDYDPNKSIDEYDINYDFYYKEIKKILLKVDPPRQMELL